MCTDKYIEAILREMDPFYDMEILTQEEPSPEKPQEARDSYSAELLIVGHGI